MADDTERKKNLRRLEGQICAMARQVTNMGDDLAKNGLLDGAYRMHRCAHKMWKITADLLDFTGEANG
jgi:hypothetical protein